MITDRYKKLLHQIKQLETAHAGHSGSVQLLAVSKGQNTQHIQTLFGLGQRRFAENYFQEARIKQTLLNHLQIEWHFIGRIQRNKIKNIANAFSWIHSISSLSLVQSISKHRISNLPPIQICLQIQNTSTQIGFSEKELFEAIEICKSLPNVQLRGLFCMPPPYQDEKTTRAMFARAYSLFKRAQEKIPLDTLSMGMSQDFHLAIAEGTTCIRLGTALFGERVY